MIEKLKAKGFKYNQRLDYLTGEFNGNNVIISIATNNNKVWRIVLVDAIARDETEIRIRFNNLIRQFNKNTRYIPAYLTDPTIDDNEDISYEMSIRNKRYEAVFYQKSTQGIKIEQEYEKYLETNSLSEEKANELTKEMYATRESNSKRLVWFMIDGNYSDYRIYMFYDNEYNHSDGEDL